MEKVDKTETRSGGRSSRPRSTTCCASRAPSARSPAPTGTTRTTASTAARAAARSCSAPTPSSTPAPAGRASSTRWTHDAVETADRQQPLHAPHRGRLQALRRPPRARLRRRPGPDRPALLHQQLLAGLRAAERARRSAQAGIDAPGAAGLDQRRAAGATRAVGLLAVLDQRDQRPADGDRGAVERVQDLGRGVGARGGSGRRAGAPGSRSCSSTRSARGSAPGSGSRPRSRTCAPPGRRGRRPRCRRPGRGARARRGSAPRSRGCARARRSTPPGATNENISTLSNWCTRKIPRVSLPAAPASRRKQVEIPA